MITTYTYGQFKLIIKIPEDKSKPPVAELEYTKKKTLIPHTITIVLEEFDHLGDLFTCITKRKQGIPDDVEKI